MSVMPGLRSHIRRAAALLAWVGMLALPMRALAACPMIEDAESASASHHTVPVNGVDEHAGHDMSAPAADAQSAPESPGDVPFEPCPDLAHCAVAAIPSPLAAESAATSPAPALRIAAFTAPLSVARVLEPPPPKA